MNPKQAGASESKSPNDVEEWSLNATALRLGRCIEVLDAMRQEDGRSMSERIQVGYAAGWLEGDLYRIQGTVASQCAAWFDDSAFKGLSS